MKKAAITLVILIVSGCAPNGMAYDPSLPAFNAAYEQCKTLKGDPYQRCIHQHMPQQTYVQRPVYAPAYRPVYQPVYIQPLPQLQPNPSVHCTSMNLGGGMTTMNCY